jgi:hypothetical protein
MAFIQSSMRWPWFLETAENKIQIAANLSTTSYLQVQLLHMRLHQVQWAFVIKGATLFEKVPLKFEDGITIHVVKIVKE